MSQSYLSIHSGGVNFKYFEVKRSADTSEPKASKGYDEMSRRITRALLQVDQLQLPAPALPVR